MNGRVGMFGKRSWGIPYLLYIPYLLCMPVHGRDEQRFALHDGEKEMPP